MPANFDIDKIELHKFLLDNGKLNLYHANTVATSITFLNQKALLSRKYVEDNGLFQTEQSSDNKDKEFEIYDDIFLDFIDIHSELKRANKYGPFLFSFSIELLKSNLIETVRITKKNPIYWRSNETEKDWYYSNIKEFKDNYKFGRRRNDYGNMIILKDIDGNIPFKPHLNRMIFDNPHLMVNYQGEQKYLAKLLAEDLLEVINSNGFGGTLRTIRHSKRTFGCACFFQYNLMLIRDMKNLRRLFHNNPI